jgi:hypothetical protein
MQDEKINTGLNNQMPGNSGRTEAIEDDILEFNPTWGSGIYGYISTEHDWCDANLANSTSVYPPAGTDLSQYHTYGMLWVPASSSNSWYGYREAFFDGVPQGAICWKGNQNYTAGVFPQTANLMGSYLFSLQDQDLYDLILGNAENGTSGVQTMNVDYVHVYAVIQSSKVVIWQNLPPVPTTLVANQGAAQINLQCLSRHDKRRRKREGDRGRNYDQQLCRHDRHQ